MCWTPWQAWVAGNLHLSGVGPGEQALAWGESTVITERLSLYFYEPY